MFVPPRHTMLKSRQLVLQTRLAPIRSQIIICRPLTAFLLQRKPQRSSTVPGFHPKVASAIAVEFGGIAWSTAGEVDAGILFNEGEVCAANDSVGDGGVVPEEAVVDGVAGMVVGYVYDHAG